MSALTESAIREAKRIEEDALYSSKSNFIVGLHWNRWHYWLGIPTVILAALAGASALANFDFGKEIAAALSLLVTILASLNTFLNPQGKANLHKNIGNSYNSLKNKTRIFYGTEIKHIQDEGAIVAALKTLSSERDKLNKNCPHIPSWAFKEAQKGIDEGQAAYKVDAE